MSYTDVSTRFNNVLQGFYPHVYWNITGIFDGNVMGLNGIVVGFCRNIMGFHVHVMDFYRNVLGFNVKIKGYNSQQ